MAATPMARLMCSISRLPQYWLTKMLRPLCTPNTMEISRNTGTLAVVTAAISLLPSWLTIRVSMRPSENVIRFCRAMGAVSRARCSVSAISVASHAADDTRMALPLP